MYVYIYIYIYIHTYVYTYVYIYIYIHIVFYILIYNNSIRQSLSCASRLRAAGAARPNFHSRRSCRGHFVPSGGVMALVVSIKQS